MSPLLKYKEDRRSIFVVALYYLVLATGFTLVLRQQELSFWIYGALVLLASQLSFVAAVITHNTIHVPIFHSARLNSLFHLALTTAYGHPVNSYEPGHNLSHHRYTQRAADLMRTNKARFRWNFLNQLCFGWLVGTTILLSNLRYTKAVKYQRPDWYKENKKQWIWFAIFLISAFIISWKATLLFIMIPHQWAAWGIMGTNFFQHDGCDAEDKYNHSRNFVGKFTNFLIFNNGFHGMHHMNPRLHWSLLPAAHFKELSPNLHPSLERNGLLPYFFEAYIYPGKRLKYDGTPIVLAELPLPGEDADWFDAADADLTATA